MRYQQIRPCREFSLVATKTVSFSYLEETFHANGESRLAAPTILVMVIIGTPFAFLAYDVFSQNELRSVVCFTARAEDE